MDINAIFVQLATKPSLSPLTVSTIVVMSALNRFAKSYKPIAKAVVCVELVAPHTWLATPWSALCGQLVAGGS